MGPKLKVKTVAGDIMLIEECFSEVNLDFLKLKWPIVFLRFWSYTPTLVTFM